jgi:LDH2 family malate/lactate/ureidoglycolate dehydrogenase
MALYPSTRTEIRIPEEVLRAAAAAVFRGCGMAQADAGTVADSLVDADLRGIHSHGVLRVADYVGKLTVEGVDPRGAPSLVSVRRGALVVDCGNNLGQIGMVYATDRAIESAGETGLALAAVRGSNHAGTMEFYARRALAHDMIGICGTNALPTMAPLGGRGKLVGINPLGIALPGGEEGDFVLDIAFGATAHGKIRVYAQKGERIPEGWAYDTAGAPTTDPIAALDGLIQPIGQHKGVGLGMAIGMLSSLLSGAGYGTETGNMTDGPSPGRDGHFTLAIDIAAFTDPAAFRARVDTILRQIRRGARAVGVERLYTPGEIEADLEAEHRGTGIPLNDSTLDDVLSAARNVGADVSSLAACVEAGRAARR